MTKAEQQGFAVASALLAGHAKAHEPIDYMEVRTLLCRAYVCGVESHKKQEPKAPRKTTESIDQVINLINELSGRGFRRTGAHIPHIRKRLEEINYDLEGVFKMLRRQWEKWRGTEWEQYFTPVTLFRPSKFENYYTARDLPLSKKPRRFGDVAYDY